MRFIVYYFLFIISVTFFYTYYYYYFFRCLDEYMDIYSEIANSKNSDLLNSPFGGRYCDEIIPHDRISLYHTIVLAFYTEKEYSIGEQIFQGRYEFINASKSIFYFYKFFRFSYSSYSGQASFSFCFVIIFSLYHKFLYYKLNHNFHILIYLYIYINKCFRKIEIHTEDSIFLN